jgi:hypothetical protein
MSPSSPLYAPSGALGRSGESVVSSPLWRNSPNKVIESLLVFASRLTLRSLQNPVPGVVTATRAPPRQPVATTNNSVSSPAPDRKSSSALQSSAELKAAPRYDKEGAKRKQLETILEQVCSFVTSTFDADKELPACCRHCATQEAVLVRHTSRLATCDLETFAWLCK